ncbi:universal stress protein [Hydrogenovibrio sp. JE_KL2]|jgi:universal stress protein A|uniref:universal stress protein n=1 Tax=Hydrogenovibrio sp. JE_KL2 TaxID=2651188 RepID=UPI0015622CF9|nr:universal stress protein [Hydrogenovibrio sp. JE_KL2]
MHNYQTILVAVDFSPDSEKAIARGKQLAEIYQAELMLLHLVEEPTYPVFEDISLSGASGIWIPEIADAMIDAAKSRLYALAEENGVAEERCEVFSGFSKVDIAERADELNVDLIVMGRHGHSFLEKLIGSTTTSVLNHAQCDVLTVSK